MIINSPSLFYLVQAFIAVANIPTTATAASAPSSYTSDTEFRDTALKITNRYRSEHDASDLKWNDTLANTALRWAKECEWRRSRYGPGENMATGFRNLSDAIESWGEERTKYDFDKPTGFTQQTKHFTQMVWQDTTSVGCARINCGWDDLYDDIYDDDRDDDDNGRDDRFDDRFDDDDRYDRDDRDDRDDDDRDDRDDRDDDRDDRDDDRDDRDDDRDDRDDDRDDRDDDRDDRDDDRDDRDDDAYGWFVVCEYWPPGNVRNNDQFKDNVKPLSQNESGGSGGSGGNGGSEVGSMNEGNEGNNDGTSNAVRPAGYAGWGVSITLLAACMGMFGLA